MQAVQSLSFSEFTENVDELLEPLKDESSITFFAHLRKHRDGGVSVLSNNYEWYYHCKEREYSIIFESVNNDEIQTPRKSIWLAEKGTSPLKVIYQELRVIFKIEYGITITVPGEDSCDYYLFATDKGDSDVINFYITNFDKLMGFIDQFNHRGERLIEQADGRKAFTSTESDSARKAKELAKPASKKHPILSKRELECALHCKEGRTAKETADILNLSRRTVEYYLEKVKIKLNCNSKYQLITKLYDQDLLKNQPYLHEGA